MHSACRLVQHTNKPTVTPTRRPCQAPKQSHFVLYSDKSRATSRRSVRMNSSSSHQSITISTLQESFQCNVLQPASVSETNSALILLSDIFGCSTSDTLKISQVRVLCSTHASMNVVSFQFEFLSFLCDRTKVMNSATTQYTVLEPLNVIRRNLVR